jgi:F0F1-type ATP synthase membrane subunit b/b'
MPGIRQDADRTAKDIAKLAQDAAYVAVGFGVLGLQKAQVRRRELEKQLAAVEGPLGDARKEIAKALKQFDEQLGEILSRLDSTFEPVEHRLPPAAQAMVQQAREARDQVRHYLTSVAA